MRALLSLAALSVLSVAPIAAQIPTDVQLPGTQPNEVSSLSPVQNCMNCHAGFDSATEPWHNWQGSMMAQATRDPVFWAALTVAEQDYPGGGDFCIRCHSPTGWAEGRSTPTNGASLLPTDADGISCSVCHKLTNPDQSEHLGIQNPPFVANDGGAPAEGYYGSGTYVLWNGLEQLGPYSDSASFHPFKKSQYHRSSQMCGTCHDVSNPLVGDLAHNNGAQVPLAPGTFSGVLGSPVAGKAAFNNFPFQYGVVERTFSEHQASSFSNMSIGAYSSLPAELQSGSIERAYQAAIASSPTGDYLDGTPREFSCQTCHVRPVTGQADKFGFGPTRTDFPLHDLTGVNYWAPQAIQYLDAQNKLVAGGGLSAELIAAMNDGMDRARDNLEDAGSLSVDGNTVRLVNLTGHKLITGYPEGRRMWLRVEWLDFLGNTLRVDGEYGSLDVQIAGIPTTVETLLDPEGPHTRIYEMELGMTQEWANQLLGLGFAANLPLSYDRVNGAVKETLGGLAAKPVGSTAKTFHFILNNTVIADNRIPPYGFSYDEARTRNALPVPESQYGNPGAGGTYDYFDEFALSPPAGAHTAKIELLYQPQTWEYVQFLSIANNGTDALLGSTGQDLLDAWLNTGMAAPHVMVETTWQDPNSPWENLGHGKTGATGVPALVGTGTLVAGTPMTIALSNAAPGALAHLIIGFSEINAPFFGGLLIPAPDVVIPNLPVNVSGELTIPALWPAGLPTGLSFAFQYLVVDGTAQGGLAHSNAIRATQP